MRCGTAARAASTVPSNTLRPRAISATRRHSRSAWAMTWVEKTTVAPRSARPRISASSPCWFTGSRPEKGSSRITSSGSWAMAQISCTFCAMPLDSAFIGRCSASPRPCASSNAIPRLRATAAGTPLRPAKKTTASMGVMRR